MLHVHYPTTDSTSTRAMALARLNRGVQVTVSADEQTAGRGRTGRPWLSPAGGAWFSVAYPVSGSIAHAQAAPLIVGLAVREAILDLVGSDLGPRLKIKWPNDLLLDDRKLAGILCEQSFDDTGRRSTIVIGVGINANNPVQTLGDENALRQPPASLVEATSRPIDRHELVRHSVRQIAAWMGRLERHGLTTDMLRRLRLHLAWVSEPVELLRDGRCITGRLLGVDREGRLTLATAARPVACAIGEVQRLQRRLHDPSADRPAGPPNLRSIGLIAPGV